MWSPKLTPLRWRNKNVMNSFSAIQKRAATTHYDQRSKSSNHNSSFRPSLTFSDFRSQRLKESIKPTGPKVLFIEICPSKISSINIQKQLSERKRSQAIKQQYNLPKSKTSNYSYLRLMRHQFRHKSFRQPPSQTMRSTLIPQDKRQRKRSPAFFAQATNQFKQSVRNTPIMQSSHREQYLVKSLSKRLPKKYHPKQMNLQNAIVGVHLG